MILDASATTTASSQRTDSSVTPFGKKPKHAARQRGVPRSINRRPESVVGAFGAGVDPSWMRHDRSIHRL